MKRVVLSNYRSIAWCDVRLEPLTFLVGLNGAGKSNFIDALRFCRDGLRAPLPQAFANRASNLQTLGHFDASGSVGFGMRFELSFYFLSPVHYSFRLGSQNLRGFKVVNEECIAGNVTESVLQGLPGEIVNGAAFWVVSGKVVKEVSPQRLYPTVFSARSTDRLYLPTASGIALEKSTTH
ncbi:MAG: AAA family ATPase [Bryobacteraceae bacterium]